MNELKTDLESLLVQINLQIGEVQLEAHNQGVEPSYLRLPNGSWPMADLLCAKAQVVNALVQMRPTTIVQNMNMSPLTPRQRREIRRRWIKNYGSRA